MYQAKHDAIVQNLNYDLVTLRQTEVLYFVNFFSTFGTQAALLAGFLASSVCQVPALESDCGYVFKQIYWVSTAISFVGAMHVLICTVFLAVYGQGLALRGPVGSMMVAVEGMVYEQEQIVMCFVFTVIFFTISSVATFFIVCPMEAALSCTVVMLIGIYYWYHYTLRIYNRFQFKKYERTWSMTSEDDYNSKAYDFFASKDKVLVNDEKVFRKSAASSSNSNIGISLHFADTISNKPENSNNDSNKNHNKNNSNHNNNNNNNNNNITSNNNNKPRESNPERVSMLNKFKGIFSSSKSVMGDHPEEDDDMRTSLLQGEHASRESTTSSTNNLRIKGHYGVPQATLGDNLRLAYSGYITMNISNSSLFSDEWKRRFIVVNNNFIFYYEDRQSFEKSPENTLKRRPTDLDGYKLQIISEDVPFIIQLIPIETEDDRKGIIFQCDTKAEADQWIAVLNTAANLENL